MTELNMVINRLRKMFRDLEQVLFEIRQYEMVMESGKLTGEEVALLAEGPTMDQLTHARAQLLEDIAVYLLSLGNIGKVLDCTNDSIQVSPEEGEASR